MIRVLRTVCVLLLVGVSATWSNLSAADAQKNQRQHVQPLAIVNVNVIPMDQERVLPAHTVVTSGDTIDLVGPTANVVPPSGAFIIDGTDQYLIPGLSDMAGGIPNKNKTDALAAYLAEGITTLRVFEGSRELLRWRRDQITTGDGPVLSLQITSPPVDQFGARILRGLSRAIAQIEQLFRYFSYVGVPAFLAFTVWLIRKPLGQFYPSSRVDAGLRWVARLCLASSIVGATYVATGLAEKHAWNRSHPDLLRVTSLGDARKAVRASKRSGYDYLFVLGQDTMPDSLYRAVLNASKDSMLPAIGGVGSLSVSTAIESGLKEVTRLQGFRSFDSTDLRAMERNSTCYLPFLTSMKTAVNVLDALRSDLEELGEPQLDSRVERARIILGEEEFSNLSDEEKVKLIDYIRFRRDVGMLPHKLDDVIQIRAKQVYEAGIVMLASSNAFDGLGRMPGHIHAELRAMVEKLGMSSFEALATATSNPGRCSRRVGLAGDFGMISEGYRADMVLLARNPLKDISATKTRQGVIARGKWFDVAAPKPPVAAANLQGEARKPPGHAIRRHRRK